jgi:hypothetical protein
MAIAIQQKVHGPTRPDLVLNLENLAGFYDARYRNAEAEELYARDDEISGVRGPGPFLLLGQFKRPYRRFPFLPSPHPLRIFRNSMGV